MKTIWRDVSTDSATASPETSCLNCRPSRAGTVGIATATNGNAIATATGTDVATATATANPNATARTKQILHQHSYMNTISNASSYAFTHRC